MNLLDEYFMEIAWVLTWVEDILGSEGKAFLWLTNPNPAFGKIIPLDLIFMGRGHKVLRFIEIAVWENG